MHSRQYISNVEGPPKFCIDLEADWLLILGEVVGESPGWVYIYIYTLPANCIALVGGPLINRLEIAITTQTPPHVSWEYKLDCVVHKFIGLIYTTVFDMMLFLKIFRFVDSVC